MVRCGGRGARQSQRAGSVVGEALVGLAPGPETGAKKAFLYYDTDIFVCLLSAAPSVTGVFCSVGHVTDATRRLR